MVGALALAAVVAWLVVRPRVEPAASTACDAPSHGSYAFRTDHGPARCGALERSSGWVPQDGVLETPAGTSATLEIAQLGTVSMDPLTSVRLLSTDANDQKLDLVHGTLHAKINAPPRLFVVRTKAAEAVDLGCEYTLSVDERGVGRLAVSYGSVSLEREGRAPTLVVENTTCRIDAYGPGTPLSVAATPALRRAADELDAGDARAFDRVLAACTETDTATLWHVMRRLDPEERGRAWDRLAMFVAPPPEAPREAVVRGDRAAIAAYKETLLPHWFARERKNSTW